MHCIKLAKEQSCHRHFWMIWECFSPTSKIFRSYFLKVEKEYIWNLLKFSNVFIGLIVGPHFKFGYLNNMNIFPLTQVALN